MADVTQLISALAREAMRCITLVLFMTLKLSLFTSEPNSLLVLFESTVLLISKPRGR